MNTISSIPKEVYYDLFKNLSLKDVVKLCNTNRSFRKFCLDNQTFIAKTKLKALQKFLNENEVLIRAFAAKNKLCFDKKSELVMCILENKFTIDLLYLVNNKLFDEAYVLITCSRSVPEPDGTWIFTNKLFNAFPSNIVDEYLKRLPPILDLMGYERVEDFLSDYSLDDFKNPTLRKYIKKLSNGVSM